MTAEKQRRRHAQGSAAPSVAATTGVRLVRKYGNRRLYDTHVSRYVTLGDLVEVFASHEEVQVVDAVSGEDLTKRVLAQAILFEEARRNSQILPIELLRELLRGHDGAAAHPPKKVARPSRKTLALKDDPEAVPEPAPASELDELKRRLRALENQVARRR